MSSIRLAPLKAAEIVDAYRMLPDAEQRAVRRVLWAAAGRAARQAWADARWQAVHTLVVAKQLRTSGRGAWAAILTHLMVVNPELSYRRKPPAGASAFWLARLSFTPKGLRAGYVAWLRRQTSSFSDAARKNHENCVRKAA